MKFFKEIKEVHDKRDAYQRDYDHSVAGMGKRQSLAYQLDGGANDEGWDQPERSYQAPEYTYYIRFKDTGTVYKQKGVPKSFANKQAANAYALAMIKNNPALKGNVLLTVDANDKTAESALKNKDDLQAKRKALQDIQMDPNTAKDPELRAELMRRKAALEKEAESLEEANYDDANFNSRIEIAKIENLKRELTTATYERRKEIDKEIKEIENQLRLYKATLPPEPQSATVEPDDGAPYMIYTDVVQAGQFGAKTLQGAKNSVRRAMMQQQAHTYAIATDNKNKIVAVWYPTDHDDNYQVGDTYRPPTASGDWQGDTLSPRYPEGHPYAGQIMPPNIPITTDWHAQEERPKESVSESAEDLPMYGAIIHRIMVAHTDILAKYGPEKIMSAAQDEAEWVGDVDEIGSSDVSISVKRVIQALEQQQGVAEAEENPRDVINVDVPMLLRVMEFAREDARSDVDLHKVAERLTQLSADGRTVTIDDYNSVVSELTTNIEEAGMSTGNQGYDNMLAVMKAVDAGQDAHFELNGEPIVLEYPEARFLAGKYKAFLRAGRQEEFLKYMNDPVMFDRLMKQLRDLIDKQKNFKGSVPGERGVEGDVPKMESTSAPVKPLPQVDEGYYYCKVSKTAKLIPEGYKKTVEGYITRK